MSEVEMFQLASKSRQRKCMSTTFCLINMKTVMPVNQR